MSVDCRGPRGRPENPFKTWGSAPGNKVNLRPGRSHLLIQFLRLLEMTLTLDNSRFSRNDGILERDPHK